MIEADAKKIQLTQGEECFVSAHRYGELSKHKWFSKWTGRNGAIYAARSSWKKGKCSTIWMHREIMNAQKGEEVDHGDGNTMNNCDSNLKIKTKTENLKNRYGWRKKANVTSP